MGLFKKKTRYDLLENWLNAVFKNEPLDGVSALAFNLYGDEKDRWSLDVVGTSSFDEDDTDWACDEITTFRTREKPFAWEESAEWETVFAETTALLRNYLATGKYADKLKRVDGIGAGFVDGDLELLYVKQ